MTKRYGRTVITGPSARSHAYAAHLVGADHADYSGSCSQPVMVALTGVRALALHRLEEWKVGDMDYAPGHGHIGDGFKDPAIRHVDLAVRCRKCPECLRARSHHWTERAFIECGRANRTWFGTLTLTPEQQSRMRMLARARLERRGSPTNLDSDYAFKEIVRPIVAEFQRYMKRLRKKTMGLRYILTVERHTGEGPAHGMPHLHLLLHETGDPITQRDLCAAWTWGFSKFKLVPPDDQRRHARYVCKYLAKSLLTRIAASRNYGK